MSAPDDDLQDLAGEYVLGTLSGEARAAVQARLPNDAALRAAVDAWEARLQPLMALVPPVEPSAQLWSRIEGSVGAARVAPVRRTPSVTSARSGWWQNLQLWRGLAGASFATAAVLAAVLVTRVLGPAPVQYVVVLVGPQDKAPGWVVQVNAQEQLSLIPLGTTPVPADKSLQFWTKADRWNGPVSLGLVTPGQPIRIPVDKLPPLEANQLFELTLEPANGSPIDRPTGPIQFIGRAVKAI